ncbi:S41 family peptidase [Tannerella forsythia]|jgi:Periplasmic protease|uniref:Peptidase S41 n=1 Tax=Tannerella forsythia TaxID=28112 RepID=A0A2A6E893_TANFO|nr:S41 family peptidase [Tannerella forsythia]BAR47692.1 carbohydrate binding domain protein [Tannerella forsythia 3313]KKY62680.1 hypothetical protein Tanf_00360 [Tannerella forsythia]PDP43897.1 peptidase S41 [Tannerella forsythia]TPE17207.1 peptidase S41 [Tannerella forsythia]SCQ21583.1 Peptidase family S41 [Tannerella forsythia]
MRVTQSIFVLLLLLSINGQAQQTSSYNLDFEKVEAGFPQGWSGYGTGKPSNYKISLDSVHTRSGKYAVSLEYVGDNPDSEIGILFFVPNTYQGKKITLSGYIKNKEVTDGFSSLWMGIDHPDGKNFVASGTVKNVNETSDWQKYELTLDMNPANTRQFILSVSLSGGGKVWFDDLKLTVDGKDIEELTPYEIPPFAAESDKEFDKGAMIDFPDLNQQKIDDLVLLGKIWGFLKYHHPAIAKGEYNWDYELFRFLPDYLQADDNKQRDRLISEWIDKLGFVPLNTIDRPVLGEVFIKPDLTWVENSDMDNDLKERLRYIYQNRHYGHHYYVLIEHFGSPLFLHENKYEQMSVPDARFRLLALYRYWNMVHYFYPSKYLTDKKWDEVLAEYIPYFMDINDRLGYERTVLRMIAEIRDSHAANLLEGGDQIRRSGGQWNSPIKVRFAEDKLVVSGYRALRDTVLTTEAADSVMGLKKGDIITHIDGKPVQAIVDSLRMYFPASNEPTRLKNMEFEMLRSNRSVIRLNYLSSGESRKKDIRLLHPYYVEFYPSDTTRYTLIGKRKDIGFIRDEILREEDVPVIRKVFAHTKGIVIDLRCRPVLAGRALSSWFVSSETPFRKCTRGNPNHPGEFYFTPCDTVYPSKGPSYKGKVVVLVDENTLSEGEYQAMMFRAGQNTVILGSQTSGADGRVSDIFLPGGIKTWISGFGVYYPDGGQTQRVGIVPDIEVKPTVKGLAEGRDELLEKAIEVVEKEYKSNGA